MHKFPRIWILYIAHLIKQGKITIVRRAFDLSLQYLPIYQHSVIWELYLEWVKDKISTIKIPIYKRYLLINDNFKHKYVEALIESKNYPLIVETLFRLLNEDEEVNSNAKIDYFNILSSIVLDHKKVFSINQEILDLERLFRQAISKFSVDKGRLWVCLANYFIISEKFNKARELFEEALIKVETKKDFTLVFDAYLKFEEQYSQLELIPSSNTSDEFNQNMLKVRNPLKSSVYSDVNIKNKADLINKSKVYRLNSLLERAPFLLSDIDLINSPNNILVWNNRIDLCENLKLKELIFKEALSNIDFKNCIGSPESLIIKFVNLHKKDNNLNLINDVFKQVINIEFRSLSILENIFIIWIEANIFYKNYSSAKEIIHYLLFKNSKFKGHTSPNLWNLYLDIIEQIGDYDQICSTYDQVIDSKLANIVTFLNYANFLILSKEYDKAFKCFEKGMNAFDYPQVYELLVLYLSKFQIFFSQKLERIRDLYHQILFDKEVSSKVFIYSYAFFEEENGTIFNCLNILKKGLEKLSSNDKIECYTILINKSYKFFGVDEARKFFTEALNSIDYNFVTPLGIKFALFEKKLGEISRARAIFYYLSQFNNPNSEEALEIFWNPWEEFELMHGSEESYLEVVRTKKNVSYKFTLDKKLVLKSNDN